MAVTIDQIKQLREATGVSMMACKKALEETNGDFDKAVDVLRKKGEAKAAASATRTTSQGLVVIKSNENKAAMIVLLCETDFVSRGDDFVAVANSLADRLLAGEIKPEDTDLPEIKDLVLKLGENIKISEMRLIEGENIGSYVHSNGKIGVLVSLKGGTPELAKDIALHIAATNPAVLNPEEIAESLVAHEKEIWADQLKKEGKPDEIVTKIMMGKEKKFREENALIKQNFVKNPEKTIESLLQEADAIVENFVRFGI